MYRVLIALEQPGLTARVRRAASNNPKHKDCIYQPVEIHPEDPIDRLKEELVHWSTEVSDGIVLITGTELKGDSAGMLRLLEEMGQSFLGAVVICSETYYTHRPKAKQEGILLGLPLSDADTDMLTGMVETGLLLGQIRMATLGLAVRIEKWLQCTAFRIAGLVDLGPFVMQLRAVGSSFNGSSQSYSVAEAELAQDLFETAQRNISQLVELPRKESGFGLIHYEYMLALERARPVLSSLVAKLSWCGRRFDSVS